MVILRIYLLDDEKENTIISTLTDGEHVIGRDKLDCKDKRVSRNHALLIIQENNVVLKSTHINPSFYKPSGGNSIKLIKKDESVTINDGDKFALLADSCWFKARVVENESSKTLKRALDLESFEKKDKKPKNSNLEIINTSPSNDRGIDFEETSFINKNKPKEIISDSEESIDFADSILNENQKPSENLLKLIENEEAIVSGGENTNKINKESPDKEVNEPDNSNKIKNYPSVRKKSRECCWYGAECYRKNSAHKQQFSHPEDSDYKEVPDCPYGSGCYRANAVHRNMYKHLNPPVPKPLQIPNTTQDSEDENSDSSTPQEKIKRKAVAKVNNYTESFEDNDPFINDASSDDFKLTDDTDTSDTDWQDSLEFKEDSQETKRLLKEAKKFTKKRTKK